MAEHHRFMYLSRADVEAVGCPPSAIMAAVELAFREKAAGRTIMPPKHWLAPSSRRFFSAMTSALPGSGAAGCKWQSGSPDNAAASRPYITGQYILNALDTGMPLAIMDSTWIMEVRAASASAVVARYLVGRPPAVLAMLGHQYGYRARGRRLGARHIPARPRSGVRHGAFRLESLLGDSSDQESTWATSVRQPGVRLLAEGARVPEPSDHELCWRYPCDSRRTLALPPQIKRSRWRCSIPPASTRLLTDGPFTGCARPSNRRTACRISRRAATRSSASTMILSTRARVAAKVLAAARAVKVNEPMPPVDDMAPYCCGGAPRTPPPPANARARPTP